MVGASLLENSESGSQGKESEGHRWVSCPLAGEIEACHFLKDHGHLGMVVRLGTGLERSLPRVLSAGPWHSNEGYLISNKYIRGAHE